MPPSTTRMYLIRHGATAANLQRPYVLQGSGLDNPLCDVGVAQAEAVAGHLASRQINAVYSSPLSRARQTASSIAQPHQLSEIPVAGLQEIDVGRWEGQSWDEIARTDRAAYEAFHAAPGHTPYHGGESYADVLARARSVLHDLLRAHQGETIAVVSHNIVIRAYAADLLGLDLNLAKNIRQANCGVNVIDYRADNDQAGLVTLNAESHLPDFAE